MIQLKPNNKTIVLTVLVSVFVFSNCTEQPKEASSDQTTETVDFNREGVAVFSQNCVSCHAAWESDFVC